jgi:hypothetical protein
VIVVELELVFGFDERGFGLGNPGSNLVVELIDGLVSGAHAARLETHPRDAASIYHEWNLLCRGVNVVAVRKLGCQQELIQVVLFVAHEDTDKLLELLVDTFGLAIGLRVVSSQYSGFDTDEAPQIPSELSNELQATVGDVISGGSVVPPHIPVV